MHLHVPWALTCAVLQHEKDNSATAIKFTSLNPAIFMFNVRSMTSSLEISLVSP